MNWPPVMKIKILQLTIHVLGLQNKKKQKKEKKKKHGLVSVDVVRQT